MRGGAHFLFCDLLPSQLFSTFRVPRSAVQSKRNQKPAMRYSTLLLFIACVVSTHAVICPPGKDCVYDRLEASFNNRTFNCNTYPGTHTAGLAARLRRVCGNMLAFDLCWRRVCEQVSFVTAVPLSCAKREITVRLRSRQSKSNALMDTGVRAVTTIRSSARPLDCKSRWSRCCVSCS
jgi:hypothetical protein